jgi:hypothetical protein
MTTARQHRNQKNREAVRIRILKAAAAGAFNNQYIKMQNLREAKALASSIAQDDPNALLVLVEEGHEGAIHQMLSGKALLGSDLIDQIIEPSGAAA